MSLDSRFKFKTRSLAFASLRAASVESQIYRLSIGDTRASTTRLPVFVAACKEFEAIHIIGFKMSFAFMHIYTFTESCSNQTTLSIRYVKLKFYRIIYPRLR